MLKASMTLFRWQSHIWHHLGDNLLSAVVRLKSMIDHKAMQVAVTVHLHAINHRMQQADHGKLFGWSAVVHHTLSKRVVVLYGISQTASSMCNGDGPIAHGKQLIQPTGLKARGHQQNVTPSHDSVGDRDAKPHPASEVVGSLLLYSAHLLFVLRHAAAQHHNLHDSMSLLTTVSAVLQPPVLCWLHSVQDLKMMCRQTKE